MRSEMHIKRFRPVLVAACAVVLIGFADAACGQGTQAPADDVRAARRPAWQGRRLGADAAGAGREDARPGAGHEAGLPDGSRVR